MNARVSLSYPITIELTFTLQTLKY